jgi:hypothetical protein
MVLELFKSRSGAIELVFSGTRFGRTRGKVVQPAQRVPMLPGVCCRS